MYNLCMMTDGQEQPAVGIDATDELPASAVRSQFSAVVGRAQHAGTVTYVTSHGRRVAAVVPVEAAEALERLEDAELSRMANAVLAEPGAPVPHHEVMAELDL